MIGHSKPTRSKLVIRNTQSSGGFKNKKQGSGGFKKRR